MVEMNKKGVRRIMYWGVYWVSHDVLREIHEIYTTLIWKIRRIMEDTAQYRIRFFGIKVHYGFLLISCQLHSLLGFFLAHARVYPVSPSGMSGIPLIHIAKRHLRGSVSTDLLRCLFTLSSYDNYRLIESYFMLFGYFPACPIVRLRP